MWWIYFDVTASSGERELDEAEEESGDDEDVATDQRHDLFVYGHLPVALGVVLAGVGLEELVVHPLDRAPSAAGWVLAGGLAVFLAGVAMIIGGTTRTLRSIWPWPVAAVPLVLAGAFVPVPERAAADGRLRRGGGSPSPIRGTVVSRRPETALAGAD